MPLHPQKTKNINNLKEMKGIYMTHISYMCMHALRRTAYAALALVVLYAFGFSHFVSAAPTDADLTLGDPRPGETTTYTFDTSGLDTSTSIQCVELDLGLNADGTGTVPGLNTTATLVSGTMFQNAGSWSVDNTASSDHQLRATFSTGEALNASGNVVWGSVDNGTTADTTYYGVFTTYTDDSCSTANETITIQFVYTDGSEVTLTVDPNFSFTVAGVGSGTTVHPGTSTNVVANATSIPFGVVDNLTNAVAAQNLTVSTNASYGYNVYARQTDQNGLTNGNGDSIAAHTGTYASPSAFSGTGTEAFGFTTQDTDIFAANEWAGFVCASACDESDNVVVADSASAVPGGETTLVGYQAGVSTDTPAGNYSTTIVYTAVPTY